MLDGLLEVLEKLEEDWFPHLHSFFLCLAEEVIILIFQLFVLETSSMHLYFFLVAEVRHCLLRKLLLNRDGLGQWLLLYFVVIFAFAINLHGVGVTLSTSSNSYESMRDTLNLVGPVLRSLTSLRRPWPYW